MALAAVLLDLDDTLLDGRGIEREMLAELAAAAGEELGGVDATAMRTRFYATREDHYGRVLSGEWDIGRYREAHLRQVLEPWGAPSAALVARAAAIRGTLPGRARLAAGAEALLDELARRGLRTGLLTNGPSALQRGKLERVGLHDRFDAVGVSEELGAAKPDPAAFRAVLEALGVAPQEAVMVGDNLDTDVAGALATGLAGAVWLRVDPEDARRPPPGVPVADRLADVGALLG